MEQNEKVRPIDAAPDPAAMAGNSHLNSHSRHSKRRRTDPAQADHLQKYRWPAGASGNIEGRPPSRKWNNLINTILASRLPLALRKKIEQDLGMRLDKKITFEQAGTLKIIYSMLEHGGSFRVDIFEEIRVILDGPIKQQIEIGPNADTEEGFQQIKAEVASELFGTLAMRARNLNMAAPKLAELAKKAGITIDVPLVDGEVIEQK